MNSLDTNIILRFLLRDVPEQTTRAVAVITGFNCYTTDVAVTETVFVLEKVYEASRDSIALSLKTFLALPKLESNFNLRSDTLDMYRKHPKLSIIDCYLAVEADARRTQLVTFDKKLLLYAGPHVTEP